MPGGGGGQAVQDAPHVPRAAVLLLQQHPALTSTQRTLKQVDLRVGFFGICLMCAVRSGTSQRARQVNKNRREVSQSHHNRGNHKVSECEKKDNASSDIKDKYGESST